MTLETSRYIDHTFSNYDADDGPPEADYNAASKCFVELINTAFLDDKVRRPSPALRIFESGLETALATVYQGGAGDVGRASTQDTAHLGSVGTEKSISLIMRGLFCSGQWGLKSPAQFSRNVPR